MTEVTARQPARARAAVLALVGAATILHAGLFLAQSGSGAVRTLRETGSREDQLARRWGRNDYYQRTAFIVRQTPGDSRIVLPPQSGAFDELGNRGLTDYFVFPRRTAHDGDAAIVRDEGPVFRLALPGFQAPAAGVPVVRRDEAFALVQVRDRRAPPPPPRPDFVDNEPGAGDWLAALLRLGLVAAAGFPVVVRWFGMRTWPGVLVASALVGMTLYTVVMIVAGFAPVAIGPAGQLALLAAVAAAALLLLRERPRIAIERRPGAGEIAAGACAAVVLVGLFALAARRPLVEWDSLAIWGIKARAIFTTGSLRGLAEWGAWPEYPPLVPAVMALLGVGGELAAEALFPIFACCLYGLVYEGVAHLGMPGWLRVVAPLPLLLAPLIFEHAQMAYANLPLTVFVVWTVILLARWLSSRGVPSGWPAAVAAGGMVLARPDGEFYLVFVVGIALAWCLKQGRHPAALAVFALPFAIDALWKGFFLLHLKDEAAHSFFGVASQAQHLARLMLTTVPTPGTIAEVAWTYLRYSVDPALWGMIPVLFLAVALRSPRGFVERHPVETAFLGLATLGLIGLAIYVAPSWGIVAYFNVTMARMCMVVVPIVYLLTIEEIAGVLKPAGAQGSAGQMVRIAS